MIYSNIQLHLILFKGNMTCKKFVGASTATDGVKVVTVKKHKTMRSHGFCPVPFLIDLLYEATHMYMVIYK